MNLDSIKSMIRNVPNFPKQGIQFKDITPILSNPQAFNFVIDKFAEFSKKNQITAIVAPESRGFIFGAPLAYHLGIKFIPARKVGKLPYKTYKIDYELEYGTASLEIHQDSLEPTDRVLILDDLVATAGTIHGCIELIKFTKAQISGIASLIKLLAFKADQNFGDIPYLNLIEF